MAEVKKHEIDMLHGPIWNKLPLFALPVAATAILEQLFNASDIAIVGNFTGDARTLAVAAVGANSPIIGLNVTLIKRRSSTRSTRRSCSPCLAARWSRCSGSSSPHRF